MVQTSLTTIIGVLGDCTKLGVLHGLAASPVLKPLPVTETVVPTGPLFGDNVMNGPMTVMVVEAASPVLPVRVTVYVPGETEPIVKLPVGAPLPGVTKLQVGAVTRDSGPLSVHIIVSATENPAPSTTMVAPTGAEPGIRVIVGCDMTVKVAEAESPAGVPVTVIV